MGLLLSALQSCLSPELCRPLLVFNGWGLLVLRVVVAAVFFIHGWPKFKDLKTNSQNFSMMGFNPGWLWGTVVALVEFLGSLLLLAGLGVQLIGLVLAIEMAVSTIWRKRQGHSFMGGYEFDLLLLAAGLVLATSGGGALVLGF